MPPSHPDYLGIPAEKLGESCTVTCQVYGEDMHQIATHMAEAMLEAVTTARSERRDATLIVPVGPVDQFPILAKMINDHRHDWSDVALINMDEYLDENDCWIDIEHPLSFRGYMNRKFYDLIDLGLAPRAANRVFPDPADPVAVGRLIDERDGVDACFGGIGINGHIAFNEPPEPGEQMNVEQFAALPTRVLTLSRETRTINSVTVGGEISVVPRRAITVGMREILRSRQLRFYCNRPWQKGIVRRVLHGPLTAACPASLLRTHPDARLTVGRYVAEVPKIQLR